MQRRELGACGIDVPVVIFGAWAVGGWSWGGADDERSVQAIQASIDAGANAIDTAPVYGFGRSEIVVGRAIQGRRAAVVLMTKVGLRWDDERGDPAFETTDELGRKLVVRRNLRPWSVREEVEHSLKRMRVDVIDVVQVHWPDPRTPIPETMGALLELRAQGKLRAIGVSNFDVAQLELARKALGGVPLASDQPKYSLLARDIERDVLPWCRAAGVGVVVYSPLEQGLLTGKVTAERTFGADDGRSRRATFAAANRARVNAAIERVLAPIAARHGATCGQVALAWVVAQPGITAAIAGARTPEQARENAAAGALVLEPGELAELRAAFESLRLELPLRTRARGVLGVLRRLLGRR
jgi:aryl-alcohol dehydrogenase-like predicted oxidoreductase